MCEPTTIAIAAAGMQGLGAVRSAQAEKQNAKYQANIAQQNATLQEQAAQDALRRGANEANAKRIETRQQGAQMRAAYGASGVDGNYGSLLRLQEQQFEQGELDFLAIQDNAQREAYGNRVGAWNSRSDANMQSAKARNISPFFEGATTFLGSASSSLGRWGNSSNTASTSKLPWQTKGNVRPKYLGGGKY